MASAPGMLLLGIKVSVGNIFICTAGEMLTRGSCTFSALAWQSLSIRLLSCFKATAKEELKPVQVVFTIRGVRWGEKRADFLSLLELANCL